MNDVDKFDCFKAIFGQHYARQLCKGSYQELLDACDQPEHLLMADMAPVQRERLKAVLRMARLWYRAQDWSPTVVTGVGDVVRTIQPRLATLTDRVVWLLALDASGALAHEVLVQLGGDPLKPPVLRSLLRHALFKGAVSCWIADYRPVEHLEVRPADAEALSALVHIGGAIGIAFCDWVLFSPNAVRSVREQACVDFVTPVVEREAA
jgi:DNA repair protein RadC